MSGSTELEASRCPTDPCLIRSRGPSGELVLRLGMPLVDDYLVLLEGRCRPNTVLAATYDLKVFLHSRRQAAAEVAPADVLGFVTAQRNGTSQLIDDLLNNLDDSESS